MSEKVTRRNFFKLLGGGVALAAMPSIALAEKVINIPVEFGWTWFVDKNKVPVSLMNLVKETLSQNTQKIAENVSKNNSLLLKLKDGTKVNLQIEQISKQEQNNRMVLRTENKRVSRLQNSIAMIKKYPRTKEWDAMRIDQLNKMIRNEPLYGPETEEEIITRRKWVQDNQGSTFKYTKGEPLYAKKILS